MKNVAEKIRKVLVSFDLEIETAKAQLKKSNTQVYCFKDSTKVYEKNKYYYGLLNQVKYKEYIRQLQQQKMDFLKQLNNVLNLYYSTYSDLWIQHFIHNKDIDEIVRENKIKKSTIKKIFKMMNQDLINYLEN